MDLDELLGFLKSAAKKFPDIKEKNPQFVSIPADKMINNEVLKTDVGYIGHMHYDREQNTIIFSTFTESEMLEDVDTTRPN